MEMDCIVDGDAMDLDSNVADDDEEEGHDISPEAYDIDMDDVLPPGAKRGQTNQYVSMTTAVDQSIRHSDMANALGAGVICLKFSETKFDIVPVKHVITLHPTIRRLLGEIPSLVVAIPRVQWEGELHVFAESWGRDAPFDNDKVTGKPDGARYEDWCLLQWCAGDGIQTKSSSCRRYLAHTKLHQLVHGKGTKSYSGGGGNWLMYERKRVDVQNFLYNMKFDLPSTSTLRCICMVDHGAKKPCSRLENPLHFLPPAPDLEWTEDAVDETTGRHYLKLVHAPCPPERVSLAGRMSPLLRGGRRSFLAFMRRELGLERPRQRPPPLGEYDKRPKFRTRIAAARRALYPTRYLSRLPSAVQAIILREGVPGPMTMCAEDFEAEEEAADKALRRAEQQLAQEFYATGHVATLTQENRAVYGPIVTEDDDPVMRFDYYGSPFFLFLTPPQPLDRPLVGPLGGIDQARGLRRAAILGLGSVRGQH